MRILERYILNSFLRLFFGCILAFLFLYIIIDIFSHLDEFLRQKATLQFLIKYYIWSLPFIFVQITPIVCLLGGIYTLGTLNYHNELIAMRTSGLSIFKIVRPQLIAIAIICLFVFLVNDKIIPQSQLITSNLKMLIEKKEKPREITNLSIYGTKNRLFFINKFIPKENRIEGITVLEQDKNQDVRKKIVARYGIWSDGFWHFFESVTYYFDESGQVQANTQYFTEEIMDIKEGPQDLLSQRQSPEFMSIAQLNDYIRKLSFSAATNVVRNLKVDLFQRFCFPFTSLIIFIVGIPFSFIIRRRAAFISTIGIGITVGFFYYVVNAVMIAFGKSGLLPAFLSASLSHILFLGAGLYLIHRLR